MLSFGAALPTRINRGGPLSGKAEPASAGSLATAAGQWDIVDTPSLGTNYNYLFGLTCVSASDCWTVGYANPAGPYVTMIEHYDGTSWSIVDSPNVASVSNYFVGVACVNDNDCWVVGYTYNSSGNEQTLIEHYDGTAWSIVSSPNSSSLNSSYLQGVKCNSASDCWAVGFATNNANGVQLIGQTLIEHYDGTAWSTVTSPSAVAQYSFLQDVTCNSASDCWAVGVSSNGIVYRQTLIEHWDGSAWSIVTSPNTINEQNELDGLTCYNATDCWAVGYSYTQGVLGTPVQNYETLIEHYDGTAWSIVPSPNNTDNVDGNFLWRVTCSTADDCWGRIRRNEQHRADAGRALERHGVVLVYKS